MKWKTILAGFVVLMLITAFFSSKSIEVYENGKLIQKITQFPSTDTVVSVRDYYITYRSSFFYLEGSIESNFHESAGTFKTSRKLIVDVSNNQLNISSSVF